MVHGGGHHHHGGGGGWSSSGGHHHGGGGHHHRRHHQHQSWFGGGRSYPSNNVVIINNTNRGGWYTGSYQQGRRSVNHFGGEDSDCEDCCQDCCKECGCCCCCCICCAVAAGRRGNGMGKWFSLSLGVLLILMLVSYTQESWTLNAGESRQINVPWFTKDLVIHSSNNGGVNVYASKHTCPKLSGPTVSLENSLNVSLSHGDYQYDSFFLNKGSTMDVNVEQAEGSFLVLLLRGKETLGRWESRDDDQRNHLALLQRYAGANQSVRLQYTVPKSDTYFAVYDNASSKDGRATISYHVEMTTYNLEGLSPVSFCYSSTNTCVVETEDMECILVEATTTANSNDVVTVSIQSERAWWLIVLLACIPLFMGFRHQKKKMRLEQQQQRPPAYAPAATTEAVLPSAQTAVVEDEEEEPPMAVATVEYDSIPTIPAENVIPVLPPPQEEQQSLHK